MEKGPIAEMKLKICTASPVPIHFWGCQYRYRSRCLGSGSLEENEDFFFRLCLHVRIPACASFPSMRCSFSSSVFSTETRNAFPNSPDGDIPHVPAVGVVLFSATTLQA
jgi:hypothetical protein